MVLELAGVEKSYRSASGTVPVLRGADLEIDEGQYVLLEGASGAGKTTLLNLAGLLDEPDAGRVLLDGRDAARLAPRARAEARLSRIGFVFQHYYLAADLTVEENVALPALAHGASSTGARERAAKLLERVGLEAASTRLPRELSGGEQQRAAVARALVNRPAFLLCDEPTGNLDAASADAVAHLLAEARDEGAGVLLATHDPARFPQADARVRLVGGRIVSP